MAVSTLKEAEEFNKRHPESPYEIQREVRFYASRKGVRYILAHDWTIEMLDRKLCELKDKPND